MTGGFTFDAVIGDAAYSRSGLNGMGARTACEPRLSKMEAKNLIMKIFAPIVLALLMARYAAGSAIAQEPVSTAQTDGIALTLDNSDIRKWAHRNDTLFIFLNEQGRSRLEDVASGNIGETLTIGWNGYTLVRARINDGISCGRIASRSPSEVLLEAIKSEIGMPAE